MKIVRFSIINYKQTNAQKNFLKILSFSKDLSKDPSKELLKFGDSKGSSLSSLTFAYVRLRLSSDFHRISIGIIRH